MANNNHADVFQLHENHVEVTHTELWNNQVSGVTSKSITYGTFFNLLETAQGMDATAVNPVELYVNLTLMLGLRKLSLPKHLVKLEFVHDRGVYITQVYGGNNAPHVFAETQADRSRIAVKFFVDRGRNLKLDTIQVYRYTGLTVGAINLDEMVELPVLADTFRRILENDVNVRNLDAADMSQLVKRIPSRGKITANVRRAINEAKNTDTVINWEELA